MSEQLEEDLSQILHEESMPKLRCIKLAATEMGSETWEEWDKRVIGRILTTIEGAGYVRIADIYKLSGSSYTHVEKGTIPIKLGSKELEDTLDEDRLREIEAIAFAPYSDELCPQCQGIGEILIPGTSGIWKKCPICGGKR